MKTRENSPRWHEDLFIAVRELYDIVQSSPVGDKRNILVLAVAKAFNRKPASITHRLYNFAYFNPNDPHKGFKNGQKAYRYWVTKKMLPDAWQKHLRRIRREYGLTGVI